MRDPYPSRLRREIRAARGDNSVRLAHFGIDPAHHPSVGRGASPLAGVGEVDKVDELREVQPILIPILLLDGHHGILRLQVGNRAHGDVESWT